MKSIDLQGFKILVAEDNKENLDYIKMALENSGGTFFWAKNGQEAVAICQDHQDINLIIMDGMMPVLTGYDATFKIREFLPDIPVVILTAYVNTTSISEAVRAGCNDYLAKPIGIEELYAVLQKWLPGRS